ncbi:MAG TPA: hypothetical protein VKZ53_10125 [Candidatus Angelobacter sp.]|nr:hypothetical protein [Candidatus Angelobacter sp.]
MKLGMKMALTVCTLVVSFVLLDRFLHWMNQPSDLFLYSGLIAIIGLLIVAPAALSAIWTQGRGRRT